MSSNGLENMISDRKFLKRNEFADMIGRGASILQDYKTPILLLAGVLLLILVGVPTFNYYRDSRIQVLGEQLYMAGKGLKKEELYGDIIKKFSGIPAAKLAAIRLADYHLNNQAPEKALEILGKSLADTQGSDILGTLLVLKKINVLASQKKFKEAGDFAENSGGKVLPTFVDRLKLIRAELLITAGETAEAKTVYESLIGSAETLKDGAAAKDFDPQVMNDAKEKLLLINLGLL